MEPTTSRAPRELVEHLLRYVMNFPHTRTQHTGEDFTEVAIWVATAAIERAYAQGVIDGRKGG